MWFSCLTIIACLTHSGCFYWFCFLNHGSHCLASLQQDLGALYFSPLTCFHNLGFPVGSDGKASACNAGDPRFDPWVGKISWRRKWQPTPVLLPGKFHGQRSLVHYSPWSCRVRHNWATSLLILEEFPLSLSFICVYLFFTMVTDVVSLWGVVFPLHPVSNFITTGDFSSPSIIVPHLPWVDAIHEIIPKVPQDSFSASMP